MQFVPVRNQSPRGFLAAAVRSEPLGFAAGLAADLTGLDAAEMDFFAPLAAPLATPFGLEATLAFFAPDAAFGAVDGVVAGFFAGVEVGAFFGGDTFVLVSRGAPSFLAGSSFFDPSAMAFRAFVPLIKDAFAPAEFALRPNGFDAVPSRTPGALV